MTTEKEPQQAALVGIEKAKTGIKGLDEVLAGGLPKGRPTLICGTAGAGKSLMAGEFLAHGALEFGEPGVLMAFEEPPEDVAKNLASLGIDIQDLVDRGLLFTDYVYIERSEIEETGEYDLEALFIRLQNAIDTVGAKRVVLDTIEAIFTGFSNEAILRAELRRLFRWLKDKGVTAVITGERGNSGLTRHGLEEYVSDCVILLDHRVREGLATRTLRVVKYRGSPHGNDEYPFLIDSDGIWVLPVTSVGLEYPVFEEFISTGIPDLDQMLNGKGYYRGSSILVSGSAGTGKTTLAAKLVEAASERGERCLYLAYEESENQIIRNMRSVGIDLKRWVDAGLLKIHAARPSLYGPEMHLLVNFRMVETFQPSVVVVDPLSNLIQVNAPVDLRSLMVRMIDTFKMKGITALYVNLIGAGAAAESTEVAVSSLMDTWILLQSIESNGERNRGLYVLKARGIAHSNQVREFQLTSEGIKLVDVYLGPQGVLVGSARQSQEALDHLQTERRKQTLDQKRLELARRQQALLVQVEQLQKQIIEEEEQFQNVLDDNQLDQHVQEIERELNIRRRMGTHQDEDLEPGEDGNPGEGGPNT